MRIRDNNVDQFFQFFYIFLFFCFLSGFSFTVVPESQDCMEMEGHFFKSSLPLPPASQTLRNQVGDYCREFTTAHRQQPDSNRVPLHILNETYVIEKRSLKSFLSGKSYNRCKRSHQLLGAAMGILHVQAFVDQHDGNRFKTVVSNEFTQYIMKKSFTNKLTENLMNYLGSINSIQRKHQKECMEKQPNSGLGILK